MILIIDNYDSFTYNLFQYLEELGARCRVVRNDALSLREIEKLRPEKIVISPGPGTPDESGVSLDVLRHLSDKIPVLGVCLGHQAIGQVFGGKVIRAPKAIHGKISQIFHKGTGIYKGMPNPFPATRYHSLIVERRSLPTELEITCKTEDGLIMGLRHKRKKVEGIQFHPESIMTTEGKSLLKNFLKTG